VAKRPSNSRRCGRSPSCCAKWNVSSNRLRRRTRASSCCGRSPVLDVAPRRWSWPTWTTHSGLRMGGKSPLTRDWFPTVSIGRDRSPGPHQLSRAVSVMEDAGRSGMGLAALQLVGPTADATAFPGPEDTQEASNRGVGAKTVGALLGHVAGQHRMARTAASHGHRVASTKREKHTVRRISQPNRPVTWERSASARLTHSEVAEAAESRENE
jgi:hypothetical protein